MNNKHLRQRNVFNIVLFIFWTLSITVSLLETYYYQGLLLKHTSIDSLLVYISYVFVGIFYLYLANESKSKFLDITHGIYMVSTYLFGFIYYIFFIIEKIKYPNYVFSTYHIQPDSLSIPFALSIFALIFSSKKMILIGLKKPRELLKWFPLIAILVWILIHNITDILLSSHKDIGFILRNPNATYDQKMEEKIGTQFYRYVNFVTANTPEDSVILIPPFPAYPWPQSGNIPYMTYFLHPRKLLNGEEYSPKYDLIKDEVGYVLIVWGETGAVSDGYTHGWPKFDVKSEYILLLNNDGSTSFIKDDYAFRNYLYKETWGIIKIKK